MKLKLPWQKKNPVARQTLGASATPRLYQTLIDIRDNPKHAKRKAKDALASPPLWRYLYRALLEITREPAHGETIAEKALADARIFRYLVRSLDDIRKNPKGAHQLAAIAVVNATKMGASKMGA